MKLSNIESWMDFKQVLIKFSVSVLKDLLRFLKLIHVDGMEAMESLSDPDAQDKL